MKLAVRLFSAAALVVALRAQAEDFELTPPEPPAPPFAAIRVEGPNEDVLIRRIEGEDEDEEAEDGDDESSDKVRPKKLKKEIRKEKPARGVRIEREGPVREKRRMLLEGDEGRRMFLDGEEPADVLKRVPPGQRAERDVIIRRHPGQREMRFEFKGMPPWPAPPEFKFDGGDFLIRRPEGRAGHIQEAIRHLHEGGMHEAADNLADELKKARASERGPLGRLDEALARLRKEQAAVRKDLEKLRHQLNELSSEAKRDQDDDDDDDQRVPRKR